MKKTIGNYTPDAGKVLKQSERVICCTGEDGMIYVTNGYLAYKFTPREYAAVVQPAVCCEAGSWTMNNGQKTGEPPTFDLAKTFQDAEHKAASMEALERCPLNLASGYTLRSPGSHAPAIAYQNGEPFAMILPIRIDDKISRAVKAYFTQPDDNAGNADERRAELRDKLAAAEAECAALRAELDKSKATQAAAEQAAQRANETAAAAIADTVAPSPKTAAPAAEPKTAAELIASRWSNVDGVTVTIKGAQTTSPVVWLTGDTDPHADEIKAQGGKWSNKRGAYYVRVA